MNKDQWHGMKCNSCNRTNDMDYKNTFEGTCSWRGIDLNDFRIWICGHCMIEERKKLQDQVNKNRPLQAVGVICKNKNILEDLR